MTMSLRRSLFVLFLTVAVSAPPKVSAMWNSIPLDDVVRDSDVIVVGTLSDVGESSWAGWDFGNGTITVNDVLWGDAHVGDRLRLRWDNPSDLACPRVEHAPIAGVRCIWLLTRSRDGSVRADHPCRSISTESRAAVLRSLAGERKTVCLRADRTRYSSSDAGVVTLVFRNPSGAPVSYPGVQAVAGSLRIDPRVRLTLCEGFESNGPEITPNPGTIIVSSDVPPIVVPPGGEVHVWIFVRLIFDLGPGTYRFCASVEGYEPSNSVVIDLRPRDNLDLLVRPGQGRHSIALALVNLVLGCLALVSLGIWTLRVSSDPTSVTVRTTLTLVGLHLAIIAASCAIGYSTTILWNAILVVW